MKSRGIQFLADGVLLDDETYEELRNFCLKHGETDLPVRPVTLDVAGLEKLYPAQVYIGEQGE